MRQLRWLRLLIVSLLAYHAAACSSSTVQERVAACRSTDWMRFGENDGLLGVATGDRTDEFQDCTDLGHPPDLLAYQSGRTRGLESYCTAENGYDVGYEGRYYDDVCPPTSEPDFLQGYERGRADRPAYAIYPRIGIGVGSGGGTRVGVGIGIGNFGGYYGHGGRYGYGRCSINRFCW